MSQTRPSYQAIRIRVAELSLDQARQGLRQGPERGLRQVQRLIETEVRRLPVDERGPVACKAGCDFCCHLRVMATAIEVFALLDYLKQSLSSEDWTAFTASVAATDQQLRSLPTDQVLTTNLPCPVLAAGQCRGYPARPLNCRSYHSLSRQACETSFNDPGNLNLGHPELTALAKVHAGGQGGLISALQEAGFDSRQYELVTAMAESLDDPEARSRFINREQAFLRKPLVEPPTG